jgi:hypothetical protein
MRILIVSEGPHELHGALPRLVRRLLDTEVEFETEPVRSRKVRLNFRPGKSETYEKRFLAWIDYAEIREFDAIVIVVDEDGQKDRNRGARLAQEAEVPALPRAVGVAIRAFDTWMIADREAWASVVGAPVKRFAKPEQVRKPKDHAAEALQRSGRPARQREVYEAVADRLDLEELERRCPRGFQPFAERVRELRS